MKLPFVNRGEYLLVCMERDGLAIEAEILKRELDKASKVELANELMRKTLRSEVQRLEEQCSELKRKYADEVQKRYIITTRCEQLEDEIETLEEKLNEHI
jgi:predicted RNase H-like nuclease (RuvC/YqgF family)